MKIRIKLLPLEQVEDAHGDKLLATNMQALTLVAQLRTEHANARCAVHPDADLSVTVEVLPHGNIHIDKSGVCCQDFADKVLRSVPVK